MEKTNFSSFYKKLYIDLRDSKGGINESDKLRWYDSNLIFTKKMRLRIWRYFQGEYLYMLTNKELTMKCKTYSISKKKNIVN